MLRQVGPDFSYVVQRKIETTFQRRVVVDQSSVRTQRFIITIHILFCTHRQEHNHRLKKMLYKIKSRPCLHT